MNIPRKPSDILLSKRGPESMGSSMRQLTLRNMSLAACLALQNQISRGSAGAGEELRNMSGVGMIEFPTQDSVRVTVVREEYWPAVAHWLRRYARSFEPNQGTD